MRYCIARRSWPLLCLMAGCVFQDEKATLVPADPFGNTPVVPPARKAAFAPAPLTTAARVDRVGRQLVEANPKLGLRPQFLTIGAPQPEILHQGVSEIDITAGLVDLCVSDAQLAAVLSLELAKMVTEREAAAGAQARRPERQPPPEVRVGSDNLGNVGAPDLTRQAELGMVEAKTPRRGQLPLPAPDPRTLALSYLANVGYGAENLDAVQPFLQKASENGTFARQLKAPATPPRGWTR